VPEQFQHLVLIQRVAPASDRRLDADACPQLAQGLLDLGNDGKLGWDAVTKLWA
jgi:hypothetical protein